MTQTIDISKLPNPIDHPEDFWHLVPHHTNWVVIIQRLIRATVKEPHKGDAYTLQSYKGMGFTYALRKELFTAEAVAGIMNSVPSMVRASIKIDLFPLKEWLGGPEPNGPWVSTDIPPEIEAPSV